MPLCVKVEANIAQMVNRLENLDDATNLYGGVVQVLEEASTRREELKAEGSIPDSHLVVFTDGKDTAGWLSEDSSMADSVFASFGIGTKPSGDGEEIMIRALDGASRNGISLYSVAVKATERDDKQVLERLGKNGQYDIQDIPGLNDALKKTADLVLRNARNLYVFAYCSPRRNGQAKIELRYVDGENATDGRILHELTVDAGETFDTSQGSCSAEDAKNVVLKDAFPDGSIDNSKLGTLCPALESSSSLRQAVLAPLMAAGLAMAASVLLSWVF